MIEQQRDPAFWAWVLSSPEVQAGSHSCPADAATICGMPYLPLASENGGYVFRPLDRVARVWEFHSFYRPEGWGREALSAGREAVEFMFGGPAQVLVTFEIGDNWRSRPPKTFRFQAAGPLASTPEGDQRTWILTQDAWASAPARRSM